jgi:hypothetical protein
LLSTFFGGARQFSIRNKKQVRTASPTKNLNQHSASKKNRCYNPKHCNHGKEVTRF